MKLKDEILGRLQLQPLTTTVYQAIRDGRYKDQHRYAMEWADRSYLFQAELFEKFNFTFEDEAARRAYLYAVGETDDSSEEWDWETIYFKFTGYVDIIRLARQKGWGSA